MARTRRCGHSIACPRWAIAKVAPRASRHVSQAPRHGQTRRHPPPDIQIPAPTAGRYVHRIGLAPRGGSPFCPSVQARGRPSGPQRPRRRSGNGLDVEGHQSPKPLSGTCGSIASPIGGSTKFCAGATRRVQIYKERINHDKSPPHISLRLGPEHSLVERDVSFLNHGTPFFRFGLEQHGKLFRSQLVVVHSVPCQPRPYCRISNSRGSVRT